MDLQWYFGNSHQFRSVFPAIFTILVIWSVIMSGLALWHSARRKEPGWFIFFLLVHTAGFIELAYLFFIARIFDGDGRTGNRKSGR
jgi:uncharacterized protein (DUF983 family)